MSYHPGCFLRLPASFSLKELFLWRRQHIFCVFIRTAAYWSKQWKSLAASCERYVILKIRFVCSGTLCLCNFIGNHCWPVNCIGSICKKTYSAQTKNWYQSKILCVCEFVGAIHEKSITEHINSFSNERCLRMFTLSLWILKHKALKQKSTAMTTDINGSY